MELMNWVDIFLLAILLLFAIFGFVAGFTEKFFSLLSWTGAGILTIHIYPWLKPWAKQHISNETLASVITVVVIFLVLLIVFRLGTAFISSSVKGSPLGALDRGLGVILGTLTGLFLLTVLCLSDRLYLHTLDRNPTFKDSRVWSFTILTSTYLEKLLPDSVYSKKKQESYDALVKQLSFPPEKMKKAKGYGPSDRTQMNALSQKS